MAEFSDEFLALRAAVSAADLRKLKQLVKDLSDRSLLDERDFRYRYTLLQQALFLKRKRIAEFLIRVGACPDIQCGERGRTALFEAVRLDDCKLAKLLIEHGASVRVFDKSDKTPLHHALSVKMIQLLVESGADIDSRDRDGRTPLHEHLLSTECTKKLLAYGADIDVKDADGYTPLELHRKTYPRDFSTRRLLEDARVQKQTKIFLATVREFVPESLLSGDFLPRDIFLVILSAVK